MKYGLPDIYDGAPWSETAIEGVKALTGPLWRTPLRPLSYWAHLLRRRDYKTGRRSVVVLDREFRPVSNPFAIGGGSGRSWT